jgi:hypothetical protein
MIPSTFRTMRIRAITSRVWIQLPVFGKLGLMFPPKKPSSHRITRITMIVHNMRFLLFERFALQFSIQQTLLGDIHRPGRVCLRHLGEKGSSFLIW